MLHRSIAPNCTIMTIILPRDVVFGAPLALDSGINDQVEVLDKLSAAILEDARLAHTSITIHGFSNGAIHLTRHLNYPHEFFATYPHIRYLKENLTSIIYDSSPVYPTILLGARALTIGTGWTTQPNSLLELCVVRPALLTGAAVKGALRWFFGDRVREGNASATFWYDMTHGQINDSCRELYLYSDSDHLTPCKFLEELISTRRGTEVDVTSVKFIGTGHVRHYIEKKGVYEEAVRNFIHRKIKSKL